MSICFSGTGVIRLKKEKKDDFLKLFLENATKFDRNMSYMCNDDGLFQFTNYARHYFMTEFIELLKNNVDLIDSGQVHFSCGDEDGSVDNPFPYYIEVEIIDGKVFEETLNTRMPCDWYHYNSNEEWFAKEYEKKNNQNQEIISQSLENKTEAETEIKEKDVNHDIDDDLPF